MEGGLVQSREVDLLQVQEEEAKARMRSPRPFVTTGIRGHTQAHAGPAREERSTEMEEHFYTLTKPDAPTTDPPRWSLFTSLPTPGAGSPELSVSCPLAFPPRRPGSQIPGSLQGASRRVDGAKASGRGCCQAPGRAPS